MKNQQSPWLALAVAGFLFLGINLFAGTALRFWRVDMTEQSLFTLSQGTRNILKRIDEPITIRLFFSTETAQDIPALQTYARRVRELLEEVEAAGDGKIVLKVIDPEPYSEEEELANSYGISGQLVSAAGDMLFFGIAANNSVDKVETIPSLDARGTAYLEYDIAKLIHDLAQSDDDRGRVAIISSLPLEGQQAMMPGMPPQQAWAITQVLGDSFETETLNPASITGPIDPAVDVLMIAHPKGLSATARFAIDQFALGGGKVLALVDPYCYFDMPPQGQQNQFGHDRTSQLDDLLGAWGVELVPSQVAGDPTLARPVRSGNSVIDFPLWIELNASVDEGLFNATDTVSSTLSLVNFFCAGEVRKTEGGSTEVTTLLSSSPTGQTIDAVNLQFAPDVVQLAPTLGAQFSATPQVDEEGVEQRVSLAVRVSGPISSAFPDGAPEGWLGQDEVLTESSGSFNAIVIADVDCMHEALWRSSQMTQLGMLERRNNNPVLVVNAIENLLGSNDLLSLRGRGLFSRPFEKKDALEKAARERFLAKDQELQAKEQELSAEIQTLQEGADEQGVVRMTMQQFEELSAKQEEQIEIRKQRGRVKHDLSKDIEALGARLKFIHIGLVPLLVALGGLSFRLRRRRKSA
ncbi:MAG: Gldg family protein [Planctomycetota bacterium]|nr:Gldg family protein [Planctomycetota bacterium]